MILRKGVSNKLHKPGDLVETSPLWHGTNEDTVSKITAGKFDRSLAGKNGELFHYSQIYFHQEFTELLQL